MTIRRESGAILANVVYRWKGTDYYDIYSD